jgi:hypothetical protein
MPSFAQLKNILSGRSRRWGNTNNRALQVFADQIPKVLFDAPEMATLFMRSVAASHVTVEALVFRDAPKAALPIPFDSLSVERMHAVHTRGLEMFATMFMELNKLPVDFVFADMLRHVCAPTPTNPNWQHRVSEICQAEKFDILPIARGFLDQIAGIYPEACPNVMTAVSASMFAGSAYTSIVRDCLSPHAPT